MDVVNFFSNVPARASLGQMLFLHAIAIPAPPPQLAVVVVTTDPRTPEQYDGLIATQQKAAAASKGKGKVVPMLSDESDYGELLSEHEQESEEGESAAQRFQRMQYNKKLAAKKASKAKAEAALQHRAINDFSGRIPNGLGVKAKMPTSLVYKFAPHSFLCTPYELERLYKHYVNEHAPHHDQVVTYLLMNKLLLVVQKLDESLLNRTMQALLYDPIYRDLQSPIWGKEDRDFVVPQHILMRFMCVKEDGTTALRIMRALDPSQPFDLKQIAQYALIFGQLGLENTWQGIAFDFAYCMHWQTLFGFALCWALCTTSAAKPAVVRRLALVMAQPRMYQEAVASYNAAFLDQPMVAQYGSHLNIMQVHVPDEMAQNFSDNNALRVLLHNQIPLDWVDHTYTYGVVYLEQQFHSPTMSMDIFHKIDDEHIQCLLLYGTPSAIPQWNGWREISEDNHYCLLFKRDKEHALHDSPEAKGLYYYIGMDPNQVHLWKCMAAHGLLLLVPTATNIAPVELSVVAATTVSGLSAPPGPVLASQKPATNIATGNVTMALESGEVPAETASSGP
ncbi:hypothetical protein C0995_006712 [Termitomyces sp. Mi166|nr:hypothetical protein C0995_006712 [Termitomyces sp. Mi166\